MPAGKCPGMNPGKLTETDGNPPLENLISHDQ